MAPGKSDCGDPCNNPPVGARWIAGEALCATAGAARADATALRVEMSLPTAAANLEKESSVPVLSVFGTALSDGHTPPQRKAGQRLMPVSAENLISGKGLGSDVVQSRVGAAARGMRLTDLKVAVEIKRSKY